MQEVAAVTLLIALELRKQLAPIASSLTYLQGTTRSRQHVRLCFRAELRNKGIVTSRHCKHEHCFVRRNVM
jgi:hypothetical protein